MKKLKLWQFAIIIAVGFTVGAAGAIWLMDDPTEDAGSNLSVAVAEADFRLPEYPGDMFTPQKATYDQDGKLVLTLRSNVLHPEPLEEVTLSKGSEQGTVSFRPNAEGDLDVIVTDPPGDIDNAVMKLPAVSIRHLASIVVSLDAETFTGPKGATYRFTDRSPNSESSTLRLHIEYEPDDPASPNITGAEIHAGEESVQMVGADAVFHASNGFKFGRLVFPIEARALMERDDAELVITSYRENVRGSIAMPAGLVVADDRLATSTSHQGAH